MHPRPSAKYDSIGVGYDATRKADPYLVSRIREMLGSASARFCLDAACGTGNYTIALAEHGGTWVGVDHASRMIERARAKRSAARFLIADVHALPFRRGVFDASVITLALHHFASLEAAFASLASVLRPGASLVIFTSTREQMRAYWLSHYFPLALERSIEEMPARAEIEGALEAAGFRLDVAEKYFVHPELCDLFLYSGKIRPEVYLDERIRRGSSTFAALAVEQEVSRGCARLGADLASGAFEEVRARFDDSEGDYLFLRAVASEGAAD